VALRPLLLLPGKRRRRKRGGVPDFVLIFHMFQPLDSRLFKRHLKSVCPFISIAPRKVPPTMPKRKTRELSELLKQECHLFPSPRRTYRQGKEASVKVSLSLEKIVSLSQESSSMVVVILVVMKRMSSFPVPPMKIRNALRTQERF